MPDTSITKTDVMRQARLVRLRPETRQAVRVHQVLFLKGFVAQLGGLLAAVGLGIALDPFHASTPFPVIVFLALLAASVVGTAVMLVAMHRREAYVSEVARRELEGP